MRAPATRRAPALPKPSQWQRVSMDGIILAASDSIRRVFYLVLQCFVFLLHFTFNIYSLHIEAECTANTFPLAFVHPRTSIRPTLLLADIGSVSVWLPVSIG